MDHTYHDFLMLMNRSLMVTEIVGQTDHLWSVRTWTGTAVALRGVFGL